MYEDVFTARLTQLRAQKGVSSRDMSLSLGQNHGYIQAIENGKSLPSMTVFFYICEYLGISPKEFFDTEIENPSHLSALVENLKQLDFSRLEAITAVVREFRKHT